MNESGASERRPLHRAAGSNQTQICELLIKKGATIEQVSFLILLIVIHLPLSVTSTKASPLPVTFSKLDRSRFTNSIALGMYEWEQ